MCVEKIRSQQNFIIRRTGNDMLTRQLCYAVRRRDGDRPHTRTPCSFDAQWRIFKYHAMFWGYTQLPRGFQKNI
jgi:hypothetical protein